MLNSLSGTSILVTGGAGFVGSRLVERLLEFSPKKIIVLDNLLRGKKENMQGFLQNPAVEFVEGDVGDADLISKLVPGVEYLFHLAAARITRCAEYPQEAFRTMVQGTFNLIESAQTNRVRKFIYSSSASIYGMAPFFPTTEAAHPYDNDTFYGAAKLFGEQLLRSYHSMHGLNFVALRYFNIYGPRMDTDGRYTEVLVRWLECIRSGEAPRIFGDGLTSMDLVHVDDVVEANLRALNSQVSNLAFNIGTGCETTLKGLLSLLLEVNNSNLDPIFLPERKVNSVQRRLADISQARNMLGFEPRVSLREGLTQLSNWYFSLNR